MLVHGKNSDPGLLLAIGRALLAKDDEVRRYNDHDARRLVQVREMAALRAKHFLAELSFYLVAVINNDPKKDQLTREECAHEWDKGRIGDAAGTAASYQVFKEEFITRVVEGVERMGLRADYSPGPHRSSSSGSSEQAYLSIHWDHLGEQAREVAKTLTRPQEMIT